MMNVLEYKGYSARVELDPEDECFVGRLAGINDIVGFHGSTIAEIKAAFHEAVDDYIETCRRAKKTPERPYSGKVMFRVSPETHARAALAAQLNGVSLNQWAEEVLSEAATARVIRRNPQKRSKLRA
jgi:predicted HicB family RNase H-like nuclease